MHREARIEKFAFGGAGFGRCDGKACFVPLSAPGDVVEIEVTAEKKSFLNGKIRRLIQESPLRVTPPCPVFGSCGGCQWQHVPYEVQLAQKQEIFTELMVRVGRVDAALIEPIVAAPSPFSYRTRIQLKVRLSGGRVHIGFYRTGSHYVVDVPGDCLVAHPVINTLIGQLRLFMNDFPEQDQIPQIDLSVGDGGDALVLFHYIGSNHQEISNFIGRNATNIPSAKGIWIQYGRKSTLTWVAGIDSLNYGVAGDDAWPDLNLLFSRGGFSQVNSAQNLALISMVREWGGVKPEDAVLDLYCGNGNFSLPLASCVRTIVGVEDYAPSISDALSNCEKNGIGNATYICADAAAEMRRLGTSGERFDLVILDPPRTGAREVVDSIGALDAERIIYISCDPPTLARDLGILRKNGYEVVRSRAVDMFPQTYHLESITLLQRS